MIKNIIRNNAFIECNVFQFVFFINNYLAYIIIFLIDFIRLKHSMIKRIINNVDIEFDVIEIQSI